VPDPATGAERAGPHGSLWVYLEMKNIEDYELVQLYDLGGRSHPVTPLVTGKNRLEIDMTRLSSGHYFIRVVMKDESKVVQIMKNKF